MRLALEDLTPGMILAADLQETGGRLLLPAKTALTERHLRYFQMRGVVDVEVEDGEGGAGEPGAAIDPARRTEAGTRIAAIFRHADLTNPAVAQVFAYCVARELRPCGPGGRHGA